MTAVGAGIATPRIVASLAAQRPGLVDLALRDRKRKGVQARAHDSVTFLVWDRPLLGNEDPSGSPRTFLQVGYFARFGGAVFVSDPRPPGDFHSAPDEDWAWIAMPAGQIAGVPAVYFDQASGTQFPLRAVMTMEQLRAVALEWVNAGERPTSVEWLAVNSLRWKLDDLGGIEQR